MSETRRVKHLIVGTGFGGLCLAARLKQRGDNDFVILEKADAVGGTWRENTYPGAECDIPSSLYSYSFWSNPTWQHKWSGQQQILQYINQFADEMGVRSHIEFGQKVESAVYDSSAKSWLVKTDRASFEAQFVSFAVGQLHHPRTPNIEGQEHFAGQSFHAAQWPDIRDFSGKSVAVVGNAASAVQLVPEVAKTAERLTVYQRSPNWCLPKMNREYSKFEHWLAEKMPSIARLYRMNIWCMGEFGMYPMIRGRWPFTAIGEYVSKRQLRQIVKDDALREKLIPDYPIGAKRVLFATEYFEALVRPNVELVTDRVTAMDEHGINASDNNDGKLTHRKHDVVIYATGFHTNPFLKEIAVTGKSGRSIAEHWADGAYAYLGVQTADFPNLFMLYGPNTNTGHTSIVYKLEAQCEMILQLTARAGQGAVAVDEQAEQTFNQEIQHRLTKTAWDKIEDSWYKDGGRVTNNWPGSSREYRRRTKNLNWSHFLIE